MTGKGMFEWLWGEDARSSEEIDGSAAGEEFARESYEDGEIATDTDLHSNGDNSFRSEYSYEYYADQLDQENQETNDRISDALDLVGADDLARHPILTGLGIALWPSEANEAEGLWDQGRSDYITSYIDEAKETYSEEFDKGIEEHFTPNQPVETEWQDPFASNGNSFENFITGLTNSGGTILVDPVDDGISATSEWGGNDNFGWGSEAPAYNDPGWAETGVPDTNDTSGYGDN